MDDRDKAIFKIAEAIMRRDNETLVDWKKDTTPNEDQMLMAASLYSAGIRPRE